MNLMDIFIVILLILCIVICVGYLLKKSLFVYLEKLSQQILNTSLQQLEERNRLLLIQERELNEVKLQKNEQVLENKKEIVEKLIDKIYTEMNNNNNRLLLVEKERVGEFNNLKTLLLEHKEISQNLRTSTEDLKNILSNNQSRGRYGEEVAENILKMLGFQKGLDYSVNTRQDTNINRPDLTIRLPDNSKVNVDVKFPYQSLVKYQEAETREDKKTFLQQFSRDVKEKIKQVTTRDYINPEEKTLDFVVLFVPNEMVFSVICDQLSDIYEEAVKKKVVIVGPFSFSALMRMIRQSYDNFRIQEDLHRLVGLIGKFKEEFVNYNREFEKIGEKIQSVSNQYDKVATTRTNQLNRIVDKIDSDKSTKELESKI